MAWLPLLFAPAAVVAVAPALPPWLFMWSLALAVYGSLKWLTWADRRTRPATSWWRAAGYLLLWPGMDVETFLDSGRRVKRPAARERWFAGLKLCLGMGLVVWLAPVGLTVHPLVAGWIALVGIALALHFGVFHLLSLAWRAVGVDAEPIMQAPVLARSLSDFWGRRWNLAFRDLAHAYVFRPLVSRVGPTAAMLAVFLASGLVHDLVITLPAGGGYGGPTAFFLLQGFGLMAERSTWGKRMRLGRGIVGRVYCAIVVLLPLPLLFPPVFVERIVLPFLSALGFPRWE